MKKLTCEMCGSADVIKEDELFVCQYCGTKYSRESARKMMIEGTVEVTGTVRVDGSDKVENLYQLARRAKDDNRTDDSAKYYDMILIEDPTSWEAAFYSVFMKAKDCKTFQAKSAAIPINKGIGTLFKLVKRHVETDGDRECAVREIATQVIEMFNTFSKDAMNLYTEYHDRTGLVYELPGIVVVCSKTLYNLGNSLESTFGDEKYGKILAVSAWKSGIFWHARIIKHLDNRAVKDENKSVVMLYSEKVRKYDPSFQTPKISTEGCYIATAVYGSYDCAQVLVLRRYRDSVLAKTWYGRLSITFYYFLSPKIVRRFGDCNWFRSICKELVPTVVEFGEEAERPRRI